MDNTPWPACTEPERGIQNPFTMFVAVRPGKRSQQTHKWQG
jgi:hypothetical protein